MTVKYRSIVLCCLTAAPLAAAACGAKTGLKIPDAGLDAGVDAGIEDRIEKEKPPCIDLPFEGEPINLPLETRAEIGRADVAFVIDVTASMMGEISAIRSELRDVIVPGIEAEIPDVRFSVASFADFPQLPYGLPGEDEPFRQRLAMTNDIVSVQGAMNGLRLQDGRDQPESQVEALYQTATGEGLTGWIEPSLGCPTGGFGYPCFRFDALPIVLLFTDAPFHNGPGNSAPYALSPAPHLYTEARDALRDNGVKTIGFFSGDGSSSERDDLETLARDTDTTEGGRPLVFNIGPDGRNLGTDLIDAIKVFSNTLVFDIDAVVRDGELTDGVDATQFVESLVPVSARPEDGLEFIDFEAGVFRGVRSGTDVVFQLTVFNDAVAPGMGPQAFLIEVVFRADGRDVLGRTPVLLVVPGADGTGCEAFVDDNEDP